MSLNDFEVAFESFYTQTLLLYFCKLVSSSLLNYLMKMQMDKYLKVVS